MATATVTKIITSWTNSAARLPVAWAMLSCGHSGEVRERPTLVACVKCGTERDGVKTGDCASCGCRTARYTFFPDPHREEDRLTKVGDAVECKWCDNYAENLAKLKTLTAADVQHSRWRPGSERGGTYWIYQCDTLSPSGVRLLMSIEATPEAEAILCKLKASPLSPTEGLRQR